MEVCETRLFHWHTILYKDETEESGQQGTGQDLHNCSLPQCSGLDTSHSALPEGLYHLVCTHLLGEVEKEVSDLKTPLRAVSYKNLSVT